MRMRWFCIVVFFLLAGCAGRDPAGLWPVSPPTAAAPAPTAAAPQPALPALIEAVPDFSAWVVGETVTPEQQVYLNRLLEHAWYAYFSPYDRPDCPALEAVLSAGNPWRGTVAEHCDRMAQQGYYVMFPLLTAWQVRHYAFPDSPNAVRFVVRADSGGPWTADVRYFPDGARMGVTAYLRTVVDFHVAVEDGRLLIALIDEFYLDAGGRVYDRNADGEVVLDPDRN